MLGSERVWNLNRAHFLERNGGPGRKHDAPPKRLLSEPVPSGPARGKKINPEDFDFMLSDYYLNRGWDENGNPTQQILETLGLDGVSKNLAEMDLLGKPFPGGIPGVRGTPLKPKAM